MEQPFDRSWSAIAATQHRRMVSIGEVRFDMFLFGSGADPVGSIYSNETVHPYLVEGVGEDFWPETYDPTVVDRYVTVSDRDAFLTTRRLAETEGSWSAAPAGSRCTRRSKSRAGSTIPARWSP